MPGPGDEGAIPISSEAASARTDIDYAYQQRVAWQVANALDHRFVVEVDYQPGDMTRYPLVFTPLDGHVITIGTAGGGTAGMGPVHAFPGLHNATGAYADGTTLVSLGGGFASCDAFDLSRTRGYLTPDYVAEKLLRGRGGASAVALADLFAAIAAERKR